MNFPPGSSEVYRPCSALHKSECQITGPHEQLTEVNGEIPFITV